MGPMHHFTSEPGTILARFDRRLTDCSSALRFTSRVFGVLIAPKNDREWISLKGGIVECDAALTRGLLISEDGVMDGSFACPECGSQVEVQGLAPGRQVRCGFCQQLIEVPFLPRVPAGSWKRRRFSRSRWFTWTLGALGAISMVLCLAGVIQYVRTHLRAAEKGSIARLLESSRAHEESGRLDQALIDLDVALDLARKNELTDPTLIEEQQRRRGDLARRDTLAVSMNWSGTAQPRYR